MGAEELDGTVIVSTAVGSKATPMQTSCERDEKQQLMQRKLRRKLRQMSEVSSEKAMVEGPRKVNADYTKAD